MIRFNSLPLPVLSVLCALLLSGCLENEEEIVVRRDGTLVVRMSAEGDLGDLASGYPVPLHGPWKPVDAATRLWLERVGPDTGSAEVQSKIAAGAWPVKDVGKPDGVADFFHRMLGRADAKDQNENVRLVVRGEFDSVEQLGEWSAPETEFYREAFLQRRAALAVEHKGKRTVYTFTRTVFGRKHPGWDHFDRFESMLEKGTMDDLGNLSDDQIREVAAVHGQGFRHYAKEFVREALAGEYSEGRGELSLEERAHILEDVRRRVDALLPEGKLRATLKWIRAEEHGLQPEDESYPLTALTNAWKEAMRAALGDGLHRSALDEAVRFAIRRRLESTLTAFHFTGDLEDEEFHVSIRMPGMVIGGNFEELEGQTACWSFSGRSLKDRDRVLRVVSVVE